MNHSENDFRSKIITWGRKRNVKPHFVVVVVNKTQNKKIQVQPRCAEWLHYFWGLDGPPPVHHPAKASPRVP